MYRKRAGIHAQLGRQVIRGKRTIAECPEHSDLIGHSGNRQAELGLPQIPNGSVVIRWRQGVHFDIPYNSFVEERQKTGGRRFLYTPSPDATALPAGRAVRTPIWMTHDPAGFGFRARA